MKATKIYIKCMHNVNVQYSGISQSLPLLDLAILTW